MEVSSSRFVRRSKYAHESLTNRCSSSRAVDFPAAVQKPKASTRVREDTAESSGWNTPDEMEGESDGVYFSADEVPPSNVDSNTQSSRRATRAAKERSTQQVANVWQDESDEESKTKATQFFPSPPESPSMSGFVLSASPSRGDITRPNAVTPLLKAKHAHGQRRKAQAPQFGDALMTDDSKVVPDQNSSLLDDLLARTENKVDQGLELLLARTSVQITQWTEHYVQNIGLPEITEKQMGGAVTRSKRVARSELGAHHADGDQDSQATPLMKAKLKRKRRSGILSEATKPS